MLLYEFEAESKFIAVDIMEVDGTLTNIDGVKAAAACIRELVSFFFNLMFINIRINVLKEHFFNYRDLIKCR